MIEYIIILQLVKTGAPGYNSIIIYSRRVKQAIISNCNPLLEIQNTRVVFRKPRWGVV